MFCDMCGRRPVARCIWNDEHQASVFWVQCFCGLKTENTSSLPDAEKAWQRLNIDVLKRQALAWKNAAIKYGGLSDHDLEEIERGVNRGCTDYPFNEKPGGE